MIISKSPMCTSINPLQNRAGVLLFDCLRLVFLLGRLLVCECGSNCRYTGPRISSSWVIYINRSAFKKLWTISKTTERSESGWRMRLRIQPGPGNHLWIVPSISSCNFFQLGKETCRRDLRNFTPISSYKLRSTYSWKRCKLPFFIFP